jgi:protein-S-isoprenylcysteine O-methyltransferase Ste14
MGLREKWIAAIYKSATASKPVRTLLTPVGAAVFFGFITLLILLAHWLDGWLGCLRLLPPPSNLIVGLPILVVGVFLALWCIVRFLQARGTPVPLNPPRELVATGPYAVCRNPMLTGIFLALFGIGIWMNSVCMTLVFTPLFIVLNVLELKLIEEPELEQRLGEPYLAYKNRVRMFLPGWPSRPRGK